MWTRVVLVASVLGGLAWGTQTRVRVFSSSMALWADAHAKAPTKPRPTLNYARERELIGDVGGAEDLYREVIAQAWDPRRPPYMRLSSQAAAETNIAHLRIKAGKFASAMEILESTLKYWPIYPYAHYNKGTVLWELGLCQDARNEYDRALRLDPSLSLPTNPCQPREGVN